jgi:phage-related protein
MLIEDKGLERVGEPHTKHVEGRLWEMRLQGRGGISRTLYITALGRRVVIVRVFENKTERTPHRKAYEALDEEFSLASAVIDVRNRAGLTQNHWPARWGPRSRLSLA